MSHPFMPAVEHAPVLRLFGDHAPRMAALCRLRPSLLARIVFAPRPALHAIGAFLHLAPAAAEPDAVVAACLDETDPRILLLAAMPGAPSRLYRALGRAGDTVLSRAFYAEVSELCRGLLGERLLTAPSLNPIVVDHLRALLAMDPWVARFGAAVTMSSHIAESVDLIVTLLRAHGVLSDSDLCLPPGAGLAALHRRLTRAAGRLRAPDPGFDLAPPFRIIRSVAELAETGDHLGNCLGRAMIMRSSHWYKLATGDAVYVAREAPPMLAMMVRVGPDLWQIKEGAGFHGRCLAADVRQDVVAALRVAGLRTLWDSPESAFHVLGAHSECMADAANADALDDLLDDDVAA